MAKIETPRPIRGTQSMLGEDADRFHHVVETFDRVTAPASAVDETPAAPVIAA